MVHDPVADRLLYWLQDQVELAKYFYKYLRKGTDIWLVGRQVQLVAKCSRKQ